MTMLLSFLAMFTILAVCAFGMRSAQKAEARRQDGSAPKSTLAADTPDRVRGRPADV